MNWTTKELITEYEKSSSISLCFFCHDFSELWRIEEKKKNIKQKAKNFLEEKQIKEWCVNEYPNNLPHYLFEKKYNFFTNSSTMVEKKNIRILFLEWCEDKGYNTLNSIFS